MEELHHLDLVINLQSEAFKEMLKGHVSIFLSSFSDSWFYFLGSDLMLFVIHSFFITGLVYSWIISSPGSSCNDCLWKVDQ